MDRSFFLGEQLLSIIIIWVTPSENIFGHILTAKTQISVGMRTV